MDPTETVNYFHISDFRLKEVLTKYNAERTEEEVKEMRKNTFLDKYGSTCPLGCESIYQKKTQTCIERYEVDHVSKVPEIKRKAEATNMERFGAKTPSSTQEIKDKVAQTCLERFGVTSLMKSPH